MWRGRREERITTQQEQADTEECIAAELTAIQEIEIRSLSGESWALVVPEAETIGVLRASLSAPSTPPLSRSSSALA